MILKKNEIKIATILPYKESYTVEKASAVSLWISEFFTNSKFKNKNFIIDISGSLENNKGEKDIEKINNLLNFVKETWK